MAAAAHRDEMVALKAKVQQLLGATDAEQHRRARADEARSEGRVAS